MYLNDEMYDVIDIDEAIKQKQDLIAQAKALSEEESADSIKAAGRLRRRWRRIPYWESAYEDQLADEFESYLNVIYGRRHLVAEENAKAKKELIEEVKGLDMNKPFSAMDKALERWKAIGSAGTRDADDALWKEFAAARKAFYDMKHAHMDELKVHFDEAKEIKTKLIEEVKELLVEPNFYEASKKFEEIFDRWKAAGFSGNRETEDALWSEFSTLRHDFYKKRSEFFSEVRAKQKEAYAKKKELLEEARAILDKGENSREDTQAMKDINQRWREAGSCGREREDRLWKEYRQVMDAYFDGVRGQREERQARFQDKLNEVKARKTEQILSLRRQIDHLREEAQETLSERAAQDINDEIADKEDFIKEIEAEIADIESKING